MTIGWHFKNTYSKLSDTFREEIKPIPVSNPELAIINEDFSILVNYGPGSFSSISGTTSPKGPSTNRIIFTGSWDCPVTMHLRRVILLLLY